jgi:hypothetical protein
LIRGEGTSYEVVTYESEEGDNSHALAPGDEVFPEQRGLYGEDGPDPLWDDMQETENGHTFNVFFPWMMKQDGTGMETLNHIGRLELSRYIGSARNYLPEAYAFETLRINNIMHIDEDPTDPGLYYFTNAPEFSTHASGQIVAMRGAPDINPDDMRIEYITHEAAIRWQPAPANCGRFTPTPIGRIVRPWTIRVTPNPTRRVADISSLYANSWKARVACACPAPG